MLYFSTTVINPVVSWVSHSEQSNTSLLFLLTVVLLTLAKSIFVHHCQWNHSEPAQGL